MTANVSFYLIGKASLTGKECAHYRSPRQKIIKIKNIYIYIYSLGQFRKALNAISDKKKLKFNLLC